RAAIDGNLLECFDANCFGGGTVANPDVSATVSGSVVTVTAKTAGTGGNSLALSTNTSNITLNGNIGGPANTTLGTGTGTTAGSDGSNSGAFFSFWTTNAPADTATLATNVANAIARNASATAPVTASSG